jgi:hypothetical protein
VNVRGRIWLLLRVVVGLSSAIVSLYGFYGVYGIDFRRDTLLSSLYCIFPILSFFIFLFVRAPRLEVILHTVIAIGYLVTFSMLNWRTCAEMGYCSTVTSTVFETFATKPVRAAFAATLCALLATLMGTRPEKTSVPSSRKVIAE